jgi:hypothetical protein
MSYQTLTYLRLYHSEAKAFSNPGLIAEYPPNHYAKVWDKIHVNIHHLNTSSTVGNITYQGFYSMAKVRTANG